MNQGQIRSSPVIKEGEMKGADGETIEKADAFCVEETNQDKRDR